MSQDDVFRSFLSEMSDRMDDFEQALSRLEQEFSLDTVNELFRAIHTIKGGAGFFDLTNITNISHQMEDLLSRVRSGDTAFDPAMIPVFYQASDSLRQMHEAPDQGRGLNLEPLFEALKFKGGSISESHACSNMLSAEQNEAARSPMPDVAAQTLSLVAPETSSVPMPTPVSPSAVKPVASMPTSPAATSAPVKHEFIRVKVDLLDRLM